jgi:hypothetical protein
MRNYTLYYLNRTFCDTLEEQRKLLSKISIWNYKRTVSCLDSLVEEAQTYANRMETALEYQKDIHKLHKKRKALKEEIKLLKECLPEKEEENKNSVPLRGSSAGQFFADLEGED